MVDWDIHKNWDGKLGIPSEVSGYIVRAIDSKGSEDKKIVMPEDFAEHTLNKKIPLSKHLPVSIADLKANLHDRYRNKVIQKEDLKFLLAKGQDYTRAYYLHIFLDYLEHQHFWIQQTGESIEVSIDKCYGKKCVSLTETQEILVQVMDFLKGHTQDIKDDLHL